MLIIYKNLKIYKINIKTKNSNYQIPSDNNKNKSKNLHPFLICSCHKIKSIILLITHNGANKKNNGIFPILHIKKKIWDYPNQQTLECQENNNHKPINKKNKLSSKQPHKEMQIEHRQIKEALELIIS